MPSHKETNGRMWNVNLFFLTLSTFTLYVSVYALIPALPMWMQIAEQVSTLNVCIAICVFGIMMLLPGMFNAYLIDRYKRKNVSLLSLLGLILVSFLYIYTKSWHDIMFLRIVQGVLFGIATMTLGGTLVIDVSTSTRRTDSHFMLSNVICFAMLTGILCGVILSLYFSISTLLRVCMVCNALSFLCVLFVSVRFRAPLSLKMISTDRFFFTRGILPCVCVMGTSLLLGILSVRIYNMYFYIIMLVSFLLSWLIFRLVGKYYHGRAAFELGVACLLGGLSLQLFVPSLTVSYTSSLLFGIGFGFTTSQLFRTLMSLPEHCERGTAFHTYFLFFELGVMSGVALELCLPNDFIDSYFISLCIFILIILIYELYLHKLVKE